MPHRSRAFLAALLLPETLLFFVESLLVWSVVRTDWTRAGLRHHALYGLLVGTLAAGRATGALLILLAIPLAWCSGARRA